MKWWGKKLEDLNKRLDNLLNNGYRAPKWKQISISNEIRNIRREIHHLEKLIEDKSND